MKHLRDAVSVVLQKNTLFSGTVLSNLKWGDDNASMEEIDKACHIACVDEFLDRLPDGYMTKIEQGGVNVSGGQKQRLCIARAILKNLRYLFLMIQRVRLILRQKQKSGKDLLRNFLT